MQYAASGGFAGRKPSRPRRATRPTTLPRATALTREMMRVPPAARRMLATKSKPKPRFCERVKRLEQEAHDAKLAAELQ